MTNKIRNPKTEARPVLRSRVECRRTFSSGEHSIGTCESGADTAEGGRNPENRSSNRTHRRVFGVRHSDFLQASVFGFRILLGFSDYEIVEPNRFPRKRAPKDRSPPGQWRFSG